MNRRTLFKRGGTALAASVLFPRLLDASWKDGRAFSPMTRISTNENPYGPSPAARRAMAEHIENCNRYPNFEGDYGRIRERIAEYEGLSPAHVTLSSGSDEILCAAAAAFARSGTLLTADPTYGTTARYTEVVRGKAERVPLDAEFRIDLDALFDRIAAGTSLIYICNPNNPTGTLVDSGSLEDFCNAVPGHCVVLVDEAYHEYVDAPGYRSVLPLVESNPRLLVARTFSKIYGIAGVRMGYTLGHPELLARLNPHKMAMLSVPGVKAALASLGDEGFISDCRRLNAAARSHTAAAFDRLGIEYVPGEANYLWFNVPERHRDLPKRMRDRGVAFNWQDVLADDWTRVSIGTMDEMEQFTGLLEEMVG